jgi:hypothetical protein
VVARFDAGMIRRFDGDREVGVRARGYNRNLWIEVGVRSVAYPPV